MCVAYDFIEAHVNGKVGIIKLNRPKALNALCDGLFTDLVHAARSFDENPQVGAIIITGSEKAFAAGADIKEMSTRDYPDCYTNNLFRNWTDITTIVKPVCVFMNLLYYHDLIMSIDYCCCVWIRSRRWL